MIINIWIEEKSGKRNKVEIPAGMGLSLMDVLRAAGHLIPATCGGMALCATCLVEVLPPGYQLEQLGENELLMLDMLPLPAGEFRLSCQLWADERLDGCIVKLL